MVPALWLGLVFVSQGTSSSAKKRMSPLFTVAQTSSFALATLQSTPVPAFTKEPVAALPCHSKTWMVLTPPPLVHSVTTNTSPS